jgi:tripartite-type tricarboxylate transporter receptor subunit TctC
MINMLGLCRLVLAAIVAAAMWTNGATAAPYPDQPIKLVIPFPPGGTTDVLGRIFAQYLSQKLGSPVVVENKPGAASALGIDDVAKATPDGYTLLWGPSDGLAVLPAVRSNLPYQPLKDFTPLGLVAKVPFAFAVNANFPAHDIKGLVAYAKGHPGALNYGTPGIGSAGHLTTALLELRTGIKLTHVPYKGGAQAINDTMAGQIQMTTASPTALVSFVQAGKLRLLAQTGETRIALVPDVPTMIEAGVPDFVAESWFGVFGPKALPSDIATKLTQAVAATQSNPEVQSQFNKVGVVPADIPAAEFPSFLASNMKLWSDIATKADIHINQ